MECTELMETLNSAETSQPVVESSLKDVTIDTPVAVENVSADTTADNVEQLIEESEVMLVESSEAPQQESEEENKVIDSKVEQDYSHKLEYSWAITPTLLCSATEEYEPNEECENFTKGCQWSPDGTCLLVAAEDFRLRVYELPRELYSGTVPEELPMPPLRPVFKIKEGGLIYDSAWYPLMNSWDPDTCCFISTSKETPVHLWDAFTGELRATYRAYNQVDEVEAAISVQFADAGQTVWAGFRGALRVFDTNRPGRQIEDILLKNDFPNVGGIVSCIRENPAMPGLLAFGTYSKCIGLYKDGPLCSLRMNSGVTQIEFSPCGTKLYASSRRHNEFFCWDLRNPGIILYSLEGRQSDTNQRIQFSMSKDERDIVSGGTDGFVKVWRPLERDCDEVQPLYKLQMSKDCINGVSMHWSLPILATSSGQRLCDDESEIFRDNSVRFWHCGVGS